MPADLSHRRRSTTGWGMRAARQRSRQVARIGVLASVVVWSVLVPGLGASASTPIPTPAPSVAVGDEGRITWSTRPADADGPDGRAWVEQELAPGESADEFLAVSNYSDERVTFQLSAADGYFTPAGRFSMLPQAAPSTAAGAWIQVAESVVVDAGATVVVPFTTTVPDNAEPGDHAAGIAASILSTSSDPDGTGVSLESRVGFRVMTRVTGDLAPAGHIASLAGTYEMTWNPLQPGRATAEFEVVNTGNARFLVDGTVTIGGRSVSVLAPDTAQELLPGDRRTIAVAAADVWPLFIVPVEVSLDPTVVELDGSASTMPSLESSTMIWAVPWSQLLVLAGILLVVLAIVGQNILHRRRVRTAVEEAKAEWSRGAEA